MPSFRTRILRRLEALADRAVLAIIPFFAIFMAVALFRIG